MPVKKKTGESAASGRRLHPSVKLVAAVLAVLLLVLTGIRVVRWAAQRQETRPLVLINQWNQVDSTRFSPRLKAVEGIQVDSCCAEDLKQMLAACRAQGVSISLTAGFRTQDEQLSLFENEVHRLMGAGNSADLAYAAAEQRVGAPGTSEHELGLAIDVQGASAQVWMRENAWQYGFILRYPEGSESVTGRSADNSHFRYVGRPAAAQIQSLGITLEEYMGMFYTQEAEIVLS